MLIFNMFSLILVAASQFQQQTERMKAAIL